MAEARRRRAPAALNKKAPPPETWQGGRHPTDAGVIIKKQKNTATQPLACRRCSFDFHAKKCNDWQLNTKEEWRIVQN